MDQAPPPDDSGEPGATGRSAGLLTPAIVAAIVVLVISATAAITFVGATGGLRLPGALPSEVAFASPSPNTTPSVPSLAPTPPPTPPPTSSPTSPPLATPEVSSAPTPAPTSDRYLLLYPCPHRPSCFVYTVRHGDTLSGIADYFGIAYSTVLKLNSWIADPSTIRPGYLLVLPPPTR